MTDEAKQYQTIGAGKVFNAHEWTNHGSGQYVDYHDAEIYNIAAEGFYSTFKRGIKGV
jgi:hypothetical protein